MATLRRNNDVLVGATTIGVIVLVIAAVLWIKGAGLGGRERAVVVRTRDVGGIALGNPVVIRGVRAGRVESVALGERGWVVLSLDVNRDVELPADPVVLLVASSLFGEWQATITDGTGVPPDRELRAAIAEARTRGDTLPGAVLPDIAQLTSVAGRIAGDVADVAGRFESAFDDSAAVELRTSIRNFAALSADLSRTVKTQSGNLDRVSADVARGVERVNAAAARVDRITARIDSATNANELREILTGAREASRALVDATNRLRVIAEQAERTGSRLSTAAARADSVMTKVNGTQGSLGLFVNDPKLYRSSDSLVTEMRALVADIKRNPTRYIRLSIF